MAKSYVINRFHRRILGPKQFERLISKQSDGEQLFGRLNPGRFIPENVSEEVLELDSVYQSLRKGLAAVRQSLSKDPAPEKLRQLGEMTELTCSYRKTLAEFYGNAPHIKTEGKIPESHIVLIDEMFKVAAVDVTARYDQTPDGNIARALQRLRSDAAELYRKITALWAYAHNDTETARVDRPFSWASWQRISLQALTAWMNPAPPCSGMAPTGTSCPAPWGLIYNTKDTNDCLESKHCFDPQPQNGGDNAAWGKAMAYALLDITEFHQRKFALIHFFDKDDFWTDIFRPSRYTPGDVLSSVSTFLNGGINYAPPVGGFPAHGDLGNGFLISIILFVQDYP